MKAVNLIPQDTRGRRASVGGGAGVAVYLLIGALVGALALVTVYVLTTNTISDRKAKLAAIQSQAAQAQAAAARFAPYTQFAKLAQVRADTVRQIAAARFDWHHALADLSRVVPANTSLQSLSGTVVPGATVGGVGGGGQGATGGLRGALGGPAFEMTGCTSSHDDVARLMSRLRLMNGVTRVSLADSQKSDTSTSGVSAAAAPGSSVGCGPNVPSFDLVVFFQPVANAGPTGVAALSTQAVSTTTPAGQR
jgi:Tfp pilus assembly protein PilN